MKKYVKPELEFIMLAGTVICTSNPNQDPTQTLEDDNNNSSANTEAGNVFP